ncbi:MAG TPA: hypothetical protein ENN43_07670, partial [bacterium]|nr:hypothetical protein [bacterium]
MEVRDRLLKLKSAAVIAVCLFAVVLFFPGEAKAEFTLMGNVFAAGGTSGTASTENSLASLSAYRIGIPGQIGKQKNGEDPQCEEKIFGADPMGFPAYYLTDVQSLDQWVDSPAAGQSVVAVLQTYAGQFANCAWTGAAYVAARKKTITSDDIIDLSLVFDDATMAAVPQPVSQTVSYYDATLTWAGISQDPDNVISSYTVYRSTAPGSGFQALTYTAKQEKGGTVTFTDASLNTATTYYYKIAVNFEWGGTGNTINPYFISEARSNTVSVTTLAANDTDLILNLRYSPSSAQTVSTGQIITLIGSVYNNGTEYIENITMSPLVVSGTAGSMVLLSGPVPASVASLEDGSTVYFTWTYSANGTGSMQFTGSAQGTGQSSGTIYLARERSSHIYTIQTAASLSSEQSVSRNTASVGQELTVILTVTNSGQAASNNTTAGINVVGVSGTNTFNAVSLAAGPGSGIIIPGGNAGYFTWRYSVTGTGTVYFSSFATGYDANSGNTVNTVAAPSSNILLQTPSALTADIVSPASVSLSQVFTVLMRVTNTGQAAANTIAPNLTLSGGGTTSLLSGPSPASFNLSGGSTANFTWTYSATGAGTVNFSGYAAGTDANSGAGVQSASVNVNTVIQTRPNLQAVAFIWPSQVSVGQAITMVLRVSNEGQATANSLQPVPSLPGKSGTGDASFSSGPNPSLLAYLLGGTQNSFTWIYNASVSGNFSFSSRAEGLDANEGTSVASNAASSGAITIQTAANLISQVHVSQTQISTGNYLTVRLTVTNTGQAGANNVAPELNLIGSAGYFLDDGPSPASTSIGGGLSAEFTWIYLMQSGGNLQFNGRAAGQDANSGSVVASSFTNRDVIVQEAAVLISSISVSPVYSAVGWTITTVMTVSNTGQAQAVNVSPSFVIDGASTGSVTLIGAPASPVSINGGAAHHFTWTYSAASTGSVIFSGSANGQDGNNATAISSAVNTRTAYIQTPASLASSVVIDPVVIS